jgi:arabinogalactan endo-1,4-beta-galactosidase
MPTTTEEQARTFSLGYHCLCESQQPEATQCKNHAHEAILRQHDQEFDKTTASASEGTSVHDLETKLAQTILVLQGGKKNSLDASARGIVKKIASFSNLGVSVYGYWLNTSTPLSLSLSLSLR